MNLIHRYLCRSSQWQRKLEAQVLPWVLQGVQLGDNVLEVGPGPGLTTDILRPRVRNITALEINTRLAASLAARLHGSNAQVIQGDGTAMPFPDRHFSGALCLTMLHHVPSAAQQDKLLREVRRVLKPGGMFAGVDSVQSLMMRLLHIHDTLVPVNPATFAQRLESAGFQDTIIETNASAFRFRARRAS